MQAIKNTWNNYRARRRLEGLWTNLQQMLKTETSFDQKDVALDQFLQCFQTLVQGDGSDKDKDPPKDKGAETLTLTNKEISLVFEHRDRLLQTLCHYLTQERDPSGKSWTTWQNDPSQLKNTIWTLQVIIEDQQQHPTEDGLIQSFQEVQSAVIAQLTYVESPAALIGLLRLLQFVFSQEATMQEKVNFADLGGFEVLLRAMVRTDATCQEMILSFMAKQFRFELDEGKDLIASFHEGTKIGSNSTFDKFVKQVRIKFFTEIPQEYEEKLKMPSDKAIEPDVNEEYKTPLKLDEEDVIERSRENSGTMLELDPNAKVLSILRERQFLEVLKNSIETCEVSKLANILRVIQITRSFNSVGFFICEEAGIQECIMNLFDAKIKEGVNLHQSYEVLAKLCKYPRSNRVRVSQAWEFLMRITNQIVDHCSNSVEAQSLLKLCFATINATIQSHHSNAVTLHDKRGLELLKVWIQKVSNLAASTVSNGCLANLLSLASLVLKRVHDKQPSHEYALIATDLLMDEALSLSRPVRYQLLLFTAQILKDNIQKLEGTPAEGILRFVNDNMKAVFVNCVLMLQAAIETAPTDDQNLNKLTISVALLALEVQIRIKQVCFANCKNSQSNVKVEKEMVEKYMLYTSTSPKQFRFLDFVKCLLKPTRAQNKAQVNEYRGASAKPSIPETDCASNGMTRLYIASRIVVAMQASEQLPIESIISILTSREILSEDQLNPFLTMVILEQNNALSYLIQDSITRPDGNIEVLQSFCANLMRAIRSKEHAEVLHSLLSLTLLTSGSLRSKSKIDEILNQQEIVQQIDLISYSFEQQLFILQCLFELILENWVYQDPLDYLAAVIDQEARGQERRAECDQFRLFLSQANSVELLDFNEMETAFEAISKKTEDFPVEVTVINDEECRMRESPKSFNFFLLCLGQAHYSVQISIFEDLTSLAKQSLRNKRIMVQSMPQSFLLYLLHSAQQDQQLMRQPQKFDQNYIQYLSHLIQCLFSYGVLMRRQEEEQEETTNRKRVSDLQLFLLCLSQGRRLNYLFVESLIQTLSSTRSSVKKYVKLANECKQSLRTCLPPNEHQVGVATWLNLDSLEHLSQNSWALKNRTPQYSTPVLTVQLDDGIEVELMIVQEMKKLSILESHQNGYGSIAGESSIRSDSQDFSQELGSLDHEARQDMDAYQRIRATLSQRYGSAVCEDVYSIQLVVYRNQLTKEIILKRQADLEEMIAMSVFNAQQFNHYCIQVVNNKVQLHINGHECFKDIDILGSYVKGLLLPQGASVAKVVFFDQAKESMEIERLMQDLNDEIDDADLAEVPTWHIQIFQAENDKSPSDLSIKTSPQKRLQRPSKMQLDDGSFHVPLMTCSDQMKYIRVMMQQQSITIRKPTSSQKGGYIEGLIHSSNCDVFQETKNLLTLKKCMSGEEVFKAILHILEHASHDDEALLLSFRLLASLLIRNQNNVLAVFEKLNGFKRLESLLTSKICEMHNSQLKRVFAQIIEIACNELNCTFRIDPSANQQKRTTIASPILDDSIASGTSYSRLAFLKIAFTLVRCSPVDQGSYFLQMLQLLLSEDRNLLVFHRNFNMQPILNLFGVMESNYRLTNLYDSTLALFELFVDGIRRNLFQSAEQDLSMALDFILTMDIRSQREGQLLSSIQTRVIIDSLSIIAIHVLSEGKVSSLIDKLLKVDLVALSLMLLSKDEIEIREYAVKFFQLLLLKSPGGFTQRFVDAGGFATLGSFLLNPTNLYYEVGREEIVSDSDDKQGLQSYQKVSLNLAQILLDASVCRYDNVNEMSPENQTLVHQVMNQSRIAEQVVQQIKVALKTPKRTAIKFFDLLPTYFNALQNIESESSRYMCLKALQHLLSEPIQTTGEYKLTNMDQLLCQPGLLERFVNSVYNFQLAVAELSGYQISESHKLLEHIAHHSSDEGSIDPNDLLITKFKQETQNNFSRSVDCALEILTQVFVLDMLKPAHASQTINVLLNFPQEDDLLQFQALTRIFRHFQKNPKVSDRNTLTNLHRLIASLDDLVSVDQNPQIILRAINLINLMAFKSSMEVRKQMKELKLLEQRDSLIIRQVQRAYTHLQYVKSLGHSEFLLLKAVSKFSYETLASKPVFADNLCAEYLGLILLTISQPQFDPDAVAQLRSDLSSCLLNEVLQFDQNCKDTESLGLLRTYLNATQEQQPSKLVARFEDKIRGHTERQSESQLSKESERAQRKQTLISRRKEEEKTAQLQAEALKTRIAVLQRQMLEYNQRQ